MNSELVFSFVTGFLALGLVWIILRRRSSRLPEVADLLNAAGRAYTAGERDHAIRLVQLAGDQAKTAEDRAAVERAGSWITAWKPAVTEIEGREFVEVAPGEFLISVDRGTLRVLADTAEDAASRVFEVDGVYVAETTTGSFDVVLPSPGSGSYHVRAETPHEAVALALEAEERRPLPPRSGP